MSSSRSVTLNQTYEPSPIHAHNRPTSIFPDPIQQQPVQTTNSLKSIATVLGQALSTKDQQTVYQLLVTATQEVIGNTVRDLDGGRLLALFQAIQVIILEENRNMGNVVVITNWLSALLKKNIGQIINNQQLQCLCNRIQKILKKRISLLPTLHNLQKSLPFSPSSSSPSTSSPTITFTPKFHYIEQQHQKKHDQQEKQQDGDRESDMSEIGPQDLENLDQMFMDDDVDLDM